MVSDRWFMERYGLLEELGIYTVAYQLGLLVYYFLGAVNKAYVPFFFKTAEEDKNAKVVFEDIIKYYSVLILSIGLGLSIFSREIITLMVTNKAYYGAIGVIPIIALAYTVDGYYYMSVNGIFYSKKTQVLALTTGITAVTDIILNAILIPRFGMYGAAIATTAAYTVLFILTYIVSQRYYYIKWHWNVIIINVILVGATYYFGTLGPANLWTNFAYKILIYISYVAALFFLKILSYDKLKHYGAKILKR
jgi:O-antigen/teichoic acid export membrane protein